MRLVKLCSHEVENQYRLHMEPASFVSWIIHCCNVEKPEEYSKWRGYLNLAPAEKKINKKEEIERARKNTEWLSKPMQFTEQKVNQDRPRRPKR